MMIERYRPIPPVDMAPRPRFIVALVVTILLAAVV